MNPRRVRSRLDEERGAIAVIVALLMVVMVGSAAFVFDLARLRHERHMLQAAVDLGSLAGADFLPVSDVARANAARAAATAIAVQNSASLATAGLTIEFGCVVSAPVSDDFGLNFACGPGTGTWRRRLDRAGREGVPRLLAEHRRPLQHDPPHGAEHRRLLVRPDHGDQRGPHRGDSGRGLPGVLRADRLEARRRVRGRPDEQHVGRRHRQPQGRDRRHQCGFGLRPRVLRPDQRRHRARRPPVQELEPLCRGPAPELPGGPVDPRESGPVAGRRAVARLPVRPPTRRSTRRARSCSGSSAFSGPPPTRCPIHRPAAARSTPTTEIR